MIAAERAEACIKLGERVEALREVSVAITQLLSWRPESDFERHSTVRIDLAFVVEKTMWQMSGGHFTLYGQDGQSYQIGTTKLAACDLHLDGFTVDERYGDDAMRRTILKVIS